MMTNAAPLPQTARSEPVRFALRRSTRAEHAALDAHPALAALVDGSLDRDGYGRLMGRFERFYACHDAMLARATMAYGLDRFGFTYASRAAILAEDLAQLGVDGWREAPAAPLSPADSIGTLCGMLYVLEGSMLGGAVLCRAAEALPSNSGGRGCGYWRWCRDEGGRRWAMTCATLDALGTSEAARSDMLAGARATFIGFGDWLALWDAGENRLPGMDAMRC